MTTLTAPKAIGAADEIDRAAAQPLRRSAPLRLLSDTMVFTNRNLQHIRQVPEKLLDVTVQPLMFVLLFAYVFGGAIKVAGGSYREYLFCGILIQTLSFGMVGPATSIATDLTEGVLDRFRTLPTSRSAYLCGHFLAELAGLTLSMSIITVTGLAVGWRIHSDLLHALGGYGLLFMYTAAMIWLGTLVGITARTPDSVMGVAFVVVFPLTFASNAFVPIDSMPSWLQPIAAYNPVSIMVAASRQLFGNPTAPTQRHFWTLEHPVFAATAWSLLLLAVTVPLTIARFRQRTSD